MGNIDTHTHGGVRKGAGRKFLPEGERMVPISLRMHHAQIEKLSKLGGAAWIRDRIDSSLAIEPDEVAVDIPTMTKLSMEGYKMRDLKLPALYRGHPLFTTEEDFDHAREIRRLSGRVISAASAIDQTIAEIILKTVFQEVREHRELVLGSVLNSDWCSFAAKRKLLFLALEKFDLLQGAGKSRLEQNLSIVMRYRNAFAHGTLAHNVDVQELHYFEGRPEIAILNDAYFEKLEKTFLEAWEALEKINNECEKRKSGESDR